MGYLEQKIEGLRKRLRCYKYGIFYWRNSSFKISSALRINGHVLQLRFKDVADGSFISEFTQICLYDAYKLHPLKRYLKNVHTILDIGANQGLFLVAARQVFPRASITGYEPNKGLEEWLKHNAEKLNVTIRFEAVMKEDCMVNLNLTDSDLATSAHPSKDGTVLGRAFRSVVDEAGKIDILKIDCEGAEWELLENIDSWRNIRAVAFEYHLWAKPNANTELLFKMLKKINFDVMFHTVLTNDQGLIIATNKYQ